MGQFFNELVKIMNSHVNPLSANPISRLQTNCLNVFDHLLWLALNTPFYVLEIIIGINGILVLIQPRLRIFLFQVADWMPK